MCVLQIGLGFQSLLLSILWLLRLVTGFARNTLPRPIVDGYHPISWPFLGERSSSLERTKAQLPDSS